jgi:hypothetical protein
MGLITEVLFGKEVINRVPQLVKEWKKQLQSNKTTKRKRGAP